MVSLSEVEQILGLKFKNQDLLLEAITHPSYRNEHPDEQMQDNQRLEFLGDAVLDFVSGEWLFRRFPDAAEGLLTRYRSALVRTERFAEFGFDLGLDKVLLLGRGEEEGGGRQRSRNLCDAFEALIGALYLDQSVETVWTFVEPLLEQAMKDVMQFDLDKDAKSRFQEWTQAHYGATPTYETIDSFGPDHAKEFTVGVYLNGEQVAQGSGSSKQIAAQEAAKLALSKMASFNLPDEPPYP